MRLAVLLLSHPGCEGKPDQDTVRVHKSTDGLAPWFRFVADKHAMALRLEFSRSGCDVLHIKCQPGVRHSKVRRPRVTAKTRLRRVRERPKSEALRPLQSF